MKTRMLSLLVTTIVAVPTLAPAAFGQETTVRGFVPFKSFVESTQAANASDYMARSTTKVKDAAAFEEMRQHILNLYQGVEVGHSFVLDGDHFDCVPIQQQPAVRMQGLKSIATPPSTAELLEGKQAVIAVSLPKNLSASLRSSVPTSSSMNSGTRSAVRTIAFRCAA